MGLFDFRSLRDRQNAVLFFGSNTDLEYLREGCRERGGVVNIDLQAWAKVVELKALAWRDGLSPDDFFNAWLVFGVFWFIFLGWISYRILRKAFGYTQFRGTWYDEKQWVVMIQQIDEDMKAGNRVMRHDELKALRMWKFGDNKTIGVKGWGYKWASLQNKKSGVTRLLCARDL